MAIYTYLQVPLLLQSPAQQAGHAQPHNTSIGVDINLHIRKFNDIRVLFNQESFLPDDAHIWARGSILRGFYNTDF